MSRRPPLWFSLVGLGFAAAGASKLVGVREQQALFSSWGWSEDAMRVVGGLELLGALMVTTRATRRLGGFTLAGVSAAVLAAEGSHGDDALLPPRMAMLLASLTAMV